MGVSRKLVGLVLVIVASACLCLLAGVLLKQQALVVEVLASHSIVLFVGTAALVLMHGRPISYESILSTTGIRTLGTCLLAGTLLAVFPQLRTEVFILPVAVAYLAVLGYETWLGTQQLKEAGPQHSVDSQSASNHHPSSPGG